MDHLIRFLLADGQIRGQFVRLEGSWRQVTQRLREQQGRDLPPTVRHRLGELTSSALMLVHTLKFDGSLILQIQGPGPVALMAVEARTHATFRSTLRIRADAPLYQDASLADLVGAALGARFAVTLVPTNNPASSASDPANRRDSGIWQGIVPFTGDTVAEVLEHYMSRSEQIPTRLWLAADDDHAAGLLLQRVAPSVREGQDAEDDDEEWSTAQILADTLERDELLQLQPFDLARRLFHSSGVRILDERSPAFLCSCHRGSVSAMLQMLGRSEVEQILQEQGQVEVKCEFCAEPYRFTPEDIDTLFTD